ncbi:MAG: hypothetical protein P0116_00425 [Candidatus Nitrosocosmicus sp.]|nr:hypothetical protein [Candidatus Nitrosocosmicus sp.]
MPQTTETANDKLSETSLITNNNKLSHQFRYPCKFSTTTIDKSWSCNHSSTATSKARTAGIQTLSIPMHPVSSVEVAELTKIVENAHRYLQIAFAEETYLYCKSNSISFSELRESLNTKWNEVIL